MSFVFIIFDLWERERKERIKTDHRSNPK
jgi:hypothetical protein